MSGDRTDDQAQGMETKRQVGSTFCVEATKSVKRVTEKLSLPNQLVDFTEPPRILGTKPRLFSAPHGITTWS